MNDNKKHFGVITLFPDMFNNLNYGITGRAQAKKLMQVSCWNPRDFTTDQHATVDDKSYGGGPGMVMMVEPIVKAIDAAKKSLGHQTQVVYLSPQGERLNQQRVGKFAQHDQLILLAGRYEGIDERILLTHIDEECSIGDYVLSGGELAAMVLIDTITRLIPGAVGDVGSVLHDSFSEQSFSGGLLDCPHYTRPNTWHYEGKDYPVPDVLLSGNHDNIATWRLQQALGNTWLRRPELLDDRQLNDNEKVLLKAFIISQCKS